MNPRSKSGKTASKLPPDDHAAKALAISGARKLMKAKPRLARLRAFCGVVRRLRGRMTLPEVRPNRVSQPCGAQEARPSQPRHLQGPGFSHPGAGRRSRILVSHVLQESPTFSSPALVH